jgi:pyridoxamine 5'-phosphate oxidase
MTNNELNDPENFLHGQSPLQYFSKWYLEALQLKLKNPNAMVLSTTDVTGLARSRIVLLKDQRPEGLVFYTNYHSQKGRDLLHNPNCSLLFYWDELFRQVHFHGRVEKTSRKDSEIYWATRSRDSQLSQLVSHQSDPVHSREQMDDELRHVNEKFANQPVPCPENWGGYLFRPTFVEFWIGRDARFHDRYTYQLVGSTWHGRRLYP